MHTLVETPVYDDDDVGGGGGGGGDDQYTHLNSLVHICRCNH
jgi:hypothetical protein